MNIMECLMIEAVYRISIKKAAEDESISQKMQSQKVAAIVELRKLIRPYLDGWFLFFLPLAIFKKKCDYILQATTATQLKEILKPCVPRGDYGRFIEGPYHVREEELILWSMASLEAPLNDDGYRRFMALFREFFPDKADEILGK